MKLSKLAIAAYAVPAFALAVLYLPLFSYVTPFYVAERGVDIAWLGAAWIIIRLFDAFSDPLIGWLSDRTQSRWGRRRIWLVASVPVLLLATWQVFRPPEEAGLTHAIIWLFVLTLGWTMAQTPYAAWGAEIASSYDGRTRITAAREGVVLVGTVIATLVYFGAGEGGAGLGALAVVVLVALPVGVFVSVAFAPEHRRQIQAAKGIVTSWRELRGNTPFKRLLVAWFVNGLANGAPVSLFLFFVIHRLEAGEVTYNLGGPVPYAGACLLAYFGAAILGVPIWSWLAKRIGKHRAWVVGMIWTCVFFAIALGLGPGDTGLFLAVSVLTGFAFGADMALPPSIQADVIEMDAREHGSVRAGLFFALWLVATKAAIALSSGLVLITLGFAGFDAEILTNSDTALWTLTLLYAGFPIILKLIVAGVMWRFPLDRAVVEDLGREY